MSMIEPLNLAQIKCENTIIFSANVYKSYVYENVQGKLRC